jgi:hypothetical protein
MKNENLIKLLQQFPLDMEVCIFDVKKNEESASDEPTSEGVYKSIGVYQVHTDEELKELQEEFPETKNFIALEFNSET